MTLKKILFLLSLPVLGFAGPIEDSQKVHTLLTKLHLDGNKSEARPLAITLAKALPQDSPFLPTVRSALNSSVSDSELNSEQEKEVLFATGTKTDTYCKGVGLVLMQGQHADGTESRMILTRNNRKMDPNEYALMQDGSDWHYELENAYRAASTSEVYQPYGRADGYDVIEIRKTADGKIDKGLWKVDWKKGNSVHWSINGKRLEPVNIYMALQFQKWGSPDMGYKLKFEQGYEDVQKTRVSGPTSPKINLKSFRKVTQHLPTVSYKDSKGNSYSYEDCWEVESKIKLAGFSKK